MKVKLKKKKLIILVLIFIAFIFMLSPSFSKYRSQTVKKIISIITEYNVEYTTFGGKISELEKFDSYRSMVGLTLPVEGEINRTGYDFAGWYNNSSLTGDLFTKIEKNETGDKKFFASWLIARYDLTVQVKNNNTTSLGLPEGYDLVIGKDSLGGDNVVELDSNGKINVGKNEIISIRMPYSASASSSGLSFDDENISLTMRYTDGDQYIYYDFKMPRKNLTLTYDSSNDMSSYIDISKSPIIFEENVSIEGTSLTKNGFWYNGTISGMISLKNDNEKGNFYEWDYSEPFYVTSGNKETQNQLVLVNAITVYFKDCNLVATSYNTSRLSALTIDGVAPNSYYNSFGNEGALSNIANVVIDNSKNYKYTVNMYFIGDNTINCISQSKMLDSENYYGAINLYGENLNDKQSVLYLGSILENGTLDISNLTINEYSNSTYQNNFSLLFYVTAKSSGLGDINIKGKAVINAPNSWSYLKMGTMIFSGYSAGNLKYVYGSQGLKITDNSSLLIQNDLIWGRGLSVGGNGYLVVNGNILDLSHDNNQNPNTNISTSKYVIVKGNRAEFNNFNMSNGTVIANIISVSYSCNYKGGTLITNQISNYIADIISIDAKLGIINTNQRQNSKTNPFYTHSSSAIASSKYTFSGGNIYLFGIYQVNGNNYDLNYTAMSLNNPIGEIINSLGNLNNLTAMPTKENLLNKIKSINVINECMILGNNDYNNDTTLREFYLSGSNFYAAGNLNFLNNTYISKGTITTPGNVSSELDLTINGGTIDALKIGNSSDILYKSPINKLKRWSKTTISDDASITTSRIGSILDTNQSRSVVQILGGTITPKTDNVQIVYDMFLNYSLSSEFTNPESNPSNIRYSGIYNQDSESIILNLVNDDLTSLSSITILPPIESSSETSSWIFKDLSGSTLDTVPTSGYLTYQNQSKNINPMDISNEYVVFYAAKSNYTLAIKEGYDYIANSNVTFSQDNHEVNVKAMDTVSISLNDPLMENKTVIWYYDADGLLHSVANSDTEINGVITFPMPRANTDIYITPVLKLYLDEYEIELNDDGFQVELNNTRDDSIFKYDGSYIITQKNTYDKNIDVFTPTSSGSNAFLIIDGVDYKSSDFESYATFNRIKINMSNWDGENNNNITRTITFYKIIQKFNSATDFSLMPGIDISANQKVAIRIDGINELCFTKLQPTSDLYYYGSSNSTDKIVLQFTGKIQNWSQGFIGNQNGTVGAIGNVLIENLSYLQRGNNVSLAKNSNGTSTFTMNDSIVKLYNYYAGSGISQGFNQVNINNSDLDMYMAGDTSPGPFNGSKTVNINNTMLDYSVGGARNSTSLFYNVTNFNVIGTSNIKIKDVYSKGTTIRNVSDVSDTTSVVLKDSASLTAERRIRISKLSMYDDSSLNVTGLNNSLLGGYLFCSNINMYGGSLNADYIILSGYNATSDNSITTVKGYLQNDKNMVNSGFLNMTGGKVTAQTFIGGNKKTTITLNKDENNNISGTLNAKKIGSINQVYGISYYTPKVDEEYVYTYTRLPLSATITLNAGTINVSEDGYLGGMNATVNINGGTVNLENNAIIGINETDKTNLVNNITSGGDIPSEIVDVNINGGEVKGVNGYINTPYSTLNIDSTTSNPSINIRDIIAYDGTVNINDSTNHYDNPLGSGERVGVYLIGQLSAQNINITNGAAVYANDAISLTNSSKSIGSFVIGENSYLYTNTYGTWGSGNSTFTNNGTIVGTRKYSISYIMNDTYIDPAINGNINGYISGTTIALINPTRYGYTFTGWLDENNNSITEISSSDAGNKVLTAGWSPDKVEFTISIKASDVGMTSEELANEADLSKGDLIGDTFTYKEHIYVDYHGKYTDNNQLILSKYILKNHEVLEVTLDNDILNPDNNIIILNSDTITKTMMQYYKDNNSTPLNIKITGLLKK